MPGTQVHSDAIQQGLARVQSLLDGITDDEARQPSRLNQSSRRSQVGSVTQALLNSACLGALPAALRWLLRCRPPPPSCHDDVLQQRSSRLRQQLQLQERNATQDTDDQFYASIDDEPMPGMVTVGA